MNINMNNKWIPAELLPKTEPRAALLFLAKILHVQISPNIRREGALNQAIKITKYNYYSATLTHGLNRGFG